MNLTGLGSQLARGTSVCYVQAQTRRVEPGLPGTNPTGRQHSGQDLNLMGRFQVRCANHSASQNTLNLEISRSVSVFSVIANVAVFNPARVVHSSAIFSIIRTHTRSYMRWLLFLIERMLNN